MTLKNSILGGKKNSVYHSEEENPGTRQRRIARGKAPGDHLNGSNVLCKQVFTLYIALYINIYVKCANFFA